MPLIIKNLFRLKPSARHCSRDFSSKIGFFFLNTFAKSDTHKTSDLSWCANRLFRFLKRSFHLQIRIDDEILRKKNDFLVEFTHTAFNHLLDDIVWLTRLTRLLDKDCLFALYCRRIDILIGQSQRIDSSNMHSNLTTKCGCSFSIAGGFNCHQNAELSKSIGYTIMNIG